jgi:hypothetical protein
VFGGIGMWWVLIFALMSYAGYVDENPFMFLFFGISALIRLFMITPIDDDISSFMDIDD